MSLIQKLGVATGLPCLQPTLEFLVPEIYTSRLQEIFDLGIVSQKRERI